jgi:PAS domain S-box-containing protein
LLAPARNPRAIDFEALFRVSPNPYVLIDPEFVIVDMNEAYLRATMRRRSELVGRSMFEAFPSGPGDPQGASMRQLRSSLERVLRERAPDHLPLIHYDIPTPDGGFEERYWSATHTPLFDERGEIELVLQHTVDVTELHLLREAVGSTAQQQAENDLFQRAKAVQEANTFLDAERRRLRLLFEQAPGFIAVLRGPDHIFELANAAYLQLVGRRTVIGKTVHEALPDVAGQGFYELLDDVYQSGQPFVGQDARVVLQPEPEAARSERFVDFLYQPIHEADGSVSGIFVQGHDITERRRAQEQQQLLINELNHRVKNTLATVQSIAAQSFRTGRDGSDSREVFDARLIALAKAHDVLTRESWESADLPEIVAQAVAPLAGEEGRRFVIAGPSLRLPPRAALPLAMALHELCTNAAKYGSLSTPAGQVSITWAFASEDKGEHLRLCWRESGGPPVEPPRRKGFGSRLIERGLAHELNGTARIRYEPAGFVCEIEALIPRAAAPLEVSGDGAGVVTPSSGA